MESLKEKKSSTSKGLQNRNMSPPSTMRGAINLDAVGGKNA